MNIKIAGKILRTTKKTLAVAESCTGGLLGSLITDTPGSSAYFLGGIVAYDNRIKIAQLGIKKALLQKYGAVSSQVAGKMAENIRKKFGSDYGIGITGITGPDGGSKEKPVGLVYIAVSSKKKTIIQKNIFRGGRRRIRTLAANQALNLLRRILPSA